MERLQPQPKSQRIVVVERDGQAAGQTANTFGIKPEKVGELRVGRSWQILCADFNGDGSSDFAERNTVTGQMRVYQTGLDGMIRKDSVLADVSTFQQADGKWMTLVGDFTGDGKADYADFHAPSGNFWIHENVPTGFSPFGSNWGQGKAMPHTDDWKLLGIGPY